MLSDLIYNDPQITFFKKTFRKSTPIQSFRETHIIKPDSNVFVFKNGQINNTDFYLITKLWISNEVFPITAKPIVNKVSFFLIPYTNEADYDEEKYQTTEQIFAIPNVKLVSSTYMDTIEYFNLFDSTRNNKSSQYTRLPLDDLAFNNLLLARGKHFLLLHLEKNTNSIIKPIKLTIKYFTGSDIEKQRILPQPHEYLVKRQIDKTVNISPGENQLDIDFVKCPLSSIVIKSPTNISDPIIRLFNGAETQLVNQEPNPNQTVQFITAESNPEMPFDSSKWKIFMLDQPQEFVGFCHNNPQPQGLYEFESNDKIIFNNPNGETQIQICYIFYDCLSYYNASDNPQPDINYKSYEYYLKKAKYFSKKIRWEQLVQDPNRLTQDQFYDQLTQWTETNSVVPNHWAMDLTLNYNATEISYTAYVDAHQAAHPEPDPEPQPIQAQPEEQEPQAEQNPDQVLEHEFPPPPQFPQVHMPPTILAANTQQEVIRFVSLYKDMIGKIVETFEKAQAIKKPVEPDDVCEVLLAPFEPNEYYYCCAHCSGKFSVDFYKVWIEDTSKTGKCPKCLTKINKIPQMYWNCAGETNETNGGNH